MTCFPFFHSLNGRLLLLCVFLSATCTSLYLPESVDEALRKIAFEERLKIHDVVLEGIDLALRRRGYRPQSGQKAMG